MPDRTVNLLEQLFSSPSQDREDRRKIGVIAPYLLIVISAIVGFGLDDLWDGRILEARVVLATAILMLASLPLLRWRQNVRIVFRLLALLVLLPLIYELSIDGGEGYAFVWFYCCPIAAFFLFGKREGLYWVSLTLVIQLIIFLFTPAATIYARTAIIRFLLSYSIVAAIAYGQESSRQQAYAQLLAEKNNLEKALQQIKTLRGLIPICSSCKRIRDDRGYWNQLETYLKDHSEARLSHGICPDCLKSLYPKEFEEMSKSGRFIIHKPGQEDSGDNPPIPIDEA